MFVVFDIGGTKTRIALSKNGETFAEPFVLHTEKKFSTQLGNMLDAVDQLGERRKITALAGGIAGPLDPPKTKLLNSSNLPKEWLAVPIKQELETAFGVPVYLENDTALVGLGEAVRGAGKGGGYELIAYITISTGVGGVRIVDGKIDKRRVGFEPGRHIINYTDPKDGTAEAYLSGRALEERSGTRAYEIKSKEVWETEARILAVFLNNVTVFWSPDVIILGGSMITGDPAIPI